MNLSTIVVLTLLSMNCFCQNKEAISPRYKISLKEAHVGNLAIDTMLLNSYETLPLNFRQFYQDARSIFEKNKADFTNGKIVEAAIKNNISLMGGPMLGDIKADGVSIWFRPSNELPIQVIVTDLNSDKKRPYTLKPMAAGKDQRLVIDDLSPSTYYEYVVISQGMRLAEGSFRTPSDIDEKDETRVTFGSCFHKIGLHNPNLTNEILKREPNAMLLLGDIAVDDRESNMSMHRSDYLLRDASQAWKKLAANVPLYTSWDDHDYLNNDLSGIPERFTKEDREKLRAVWRKNWNNPPNAVEGIYFSTRIGQVEIIMLDTRSCRTIKKRGDYGSYLGTKQMKWLKGKLKNSSAPFKLVSSGTMWSDYITNGKDSWGTWDTIAREEIFSFIETENIPGVLFISGDRHGARGFSIPRPSGFKLFEFEAASLGGVPGPPAMAKDSSNQLFGYNGLDLKAFGEFTFNMEGNEPQATFRLIDEYGKIMEEHQLSLSQLTPQK